MLFRLIALSVFSYISCQWYTRNPAPLSVTLSFPLVTESNITGEPCLYVFGGTSSQTLYRYSIWSNIWTTVPTTNSAILCGVGEMIFKSRYWVFFGGQCGTSIFPSFMVRQLDLQTMIWTDISGSLSGASIPEMSSMSCKSMTHHLIFRHKTIGE